MWAPVWHGRRQHDSLVIATPVPAYPDQLNRQRPLFAALTAVSLVEMEVRTPCPSHTPKRRNRKALGRVTWGARTLVAHNSVQHVQSNVVKDGRWCDRIRVHSNVVRHRLAAKWNRVPLLPTGATTTRTACRGRCIKAEDVHINRRSSCKSDPSGVKVKVKLSPCLT
jgi:hypothetical protein